MIILLKILIYVMDIIFKKMVQNNVKYNNILVNIEFVEGLIAQLCVE